ncbi:MAG: hypothetical protein ACREFZ_12155, partial [Acetobacteraceae bacterium]
PGLTAEDAAARIRDDPALRATVVQVILDRAPADKVAGGHAGLRAALDEVFDDWIATADNQTASSGKLTYGTPHDKALLHDPLDPLLDSLAPSHRRFTAGRSMRDVEHSAALRVIDHYGHALS